MITLVIVSAPSLAAPRSSRDTARPQGVARSIRDVEMRADFPVIRESITYPTMDWDAGTTVERTRRIEDREALLPARPARLVSWRESRETTPRVPDQPVRSGLSNVVNRAEFRGFSAGQANRLEKNGFVVTATTKPQMFQLYEENVYWNVPSFVSADIFLHTWSDLFGYSLRKIERRIIFGWVKLLVSALRAESHRIAETASNPAVREAARRNADYFAVSEVLLKRTSNSLPRPLRENADRMAVGIRSAEGRIDGPFGEEIQLAVFKPRGHYTTSEDARNFFRAMTWLSAVPVSITANSDTRSLLQAVLFVDALMTAREEGISGVEIWTRIHDLTALFSGPSNTLSPLDLARVLHELRAPGEPVSYANDELLGRLRRRLLALPPDRIRLAGNETESRTRITFLGRRYILDGEILQRLVKWPDRPLAGGLDFADALGSERAERHLASVGEDAMFPWLSARRREVRALVAATPPEQWRSNLYWGTLWTLDALLEKRAETAAVARSRETAAPGAAGPPRFMRNAAWADKSLNTALGGWSELRHNTLLYAEAFAAEGGGDEYKVSLPKGYIEPAPIFFARMRWLAERLRADLSAAGAWTPRMEEKLSLFQSLCDSATLIVEKELLFQPLNESEARFVHFIGTPFGQITTGCLLNDSWKEDYERDVMWNALPEGQRNQAVIADIGRGGETLREVGIGPAHEIFVIVPSTAGPRLTRGAVYQYYEFNAPAENPMTDEAWKILVSSDSRPDVPEWTREYRSFETKPEPIGVQDRTDVDWYNYSFSAD
jgi:hypothetical protein